MYPCQSLYPAQNQTPVLYQITDQKPRWQDDERGVRRTAYLRARVADPKNPCSHVVVENQKFYLVFPKTVY